MPKPIRILAYNVLLAAVLVVGGCDNGQPGTTPGRGATVEAEVSDPATSLVPQQDTGTPAGGEPGAIPTQATLTSTPQAPTPEPEPATPTLTPDYTHSPTLTPDRTPSPSLILAYVPTPTMTPDHFATPTLAPEERHALELANKKPQQEELQRLLPAVALLGYEAWPDLIGVIYKREGKTAYILTDAESIRYMDRIPVITHDGIRRVGDIFSKWNSPLAVVKVCCGEFNSIEFSDNETPQVGDELTTMGYTSGPDKPASRSTTILTGTRVQDGNHLDHSYRILETDHIPNHVETGSPLLDYQGSVVGILREYGNAISADSIRKVLPTLESLEPRWNPGSTPPWSAGEMRRKLIHLQVTLEGRNYKIGNGFVYKTEGRSLYIATSSTAAYVVAAEEIGKIQVVTYDGLKMEGDLFWDGDPMALIRACCADFDPLEFLENGVLEPGDRIIGLGYATGQDNPGSYVEADVTTVSTENGYSLATLNFPLSHLEFPSSGQPVFDEDGIVAGILTSADWLGEELALPAGPMREILSRLELMAKDWTRDTTASTAPAQDWDPAETLQWSADQVRPGIVHVGDSLHRIGVGFVYRTEGDTAYIVTHSEEVVDRYRVPVITYQGHRMEADIFWEPFLPVAILRVCCGDFEPLEFSDDGTLEAGDQFTTLGYSMGPGNPASYTRANITETAVTYDGHHIANTDLAHIFYGDIPWIVTPMGAPAFNDQGRVVGMVIAHPEIPVHPDTIVPADFLQGIITHLETLQPNWDPRGITVTNFYEHGYWRTWPELQAKDDNKRDPFVQIKGNGPKWDEFGYWFQAKCDVTAKTIVAALIERPHRDEEFISTEQGTWTLVKLVIDGKDVGTARWMKWGPESYSGTIHYVPEETIGSLMDTLSLGAHLLEIIKNPDTRTPEYHRFVVTGSENVVGPVAEACR